MTVLTYSARRLRFAHATAGESALSEHLVVERLERVRHVVRGEPLEDQSAPAFADPAAQVAAGEEPPDRRRQRCRVVPGDEESGLTVEHGLGDAADIGSDHCRACQQRFQQGQREALEPGRKGEHVERPQISSCIVPPAAPYHPISDAESHGELLERTALAAVTDDEECGALEIRQRPNEEIDALLVLEASDGADERPRTWPRKRLPQLVGNAVVNGS